MPRAKRSTNTNKWIFSNRFVTKQKQGQRLLPKFTTVLQAVLLVVQLEAGFLHRDHINLRSVYSILHLMDDLSTIARLQANPHFHGTGAGDQELLLLRREKTSK